MSSQKLFGLPSLPPELKSLSPFLQRADELKNKEPIIAYWCTSKLRLFTLRIDSCPF
jgi:vacuolar protein sorting-associated protein VTA1